MKSKKSTELLSLVEDLPTTAQDVAVLRQLRLLSSRLSPEQYRRLLESMGPASGAVLRSRKGPSGEPFEL